MTSALALALCLSPAAARADVTVQLDPAVGSNFASQYQLQLADLQQRVQARLEEAFNVLRPDEYMRAFADAAAFSAKGLGVDYATNPQVFSFGFSGNVTVAVGDQGFDPKGAEPPVAGVAANLALMLGVNVGHVIRNPYLERLVVYANGFTRGGKYKQLDMKLTSFGFHALYKVWVPTQGDRSRLLFEWGGIDVSSGLEIGHFRVSLAKNLEESFHIDSGVSGQQANLKLISQGELTVSADTFVVPIEASTNIRLLSLLSLYGGLGLDLVAGSGNLRIDLDGDLQGTAPQGNVVDLGTAHIVATSNHSPSAGRLRFFAGTQLNIWRLRVFAQANLAPDRAFGVAVGARIGW
jgi:hypothetical protein